VAFTGDTFDVDEARTRELRDAMAAKG